MDVPWRAAGLLILMAALSLVPAVAGAGGNEVSICHFPPGNMDGYHTISVGQNAADAHARNHPYDFVGECCEGFDECDDGDPCTADTCHGFCANEPADCSDGNLCTNDSCDPSTGCVNEVILCPDDGDKCTVDACVPTTGQCASEVRACATAEDCEDGSLCTVHECDFGGLCGEQGSGFCRTRPEFCIQQPCSISSCDPRVGCVYELECEDGNPCTVEDCHPFKGCTSYPLCEDFDSCTVDICDASGQAPMCENEPIPECILACPCWDAADIESTFAATSTCVNQGFIVTVQSANATTRFSVTLKGALVGEDSNDVTRVENNVTTCEEELRFPPDGSNRAEALLCAELLRNSSICNP